MSDLLERLEKATGPDNRLDCEIEMALFVPDENHVAVRMNNAGTKVVYTRRDGRSDTYWPYDHTLNPENRARTIRLLRALPGTTQP